MKTQRIVAAVAAASLAFSGAAFAQSAGAQDQARRSSACPAGRQQGRATSSRLA